MKTERAERLICMIASSIIALMLLTCLAMNAEASSCSLKIDGVIIESDAAPIIENNTTLVPIAVIADYLGGTSSWDQEAQQATIKNGNTTVVLTNRSKNATVNGISYTLTTAPRIVTVDADGGGRTMVPLRFIAEAFGYNVDWDDSTRTAIVNTDQAKQQIAITGIKVQTNQTYSGSGKYTLVSITADKSLKYGGYKTVMLSDPYRCYVDIASSKLGSGVKDQLVDADKSYVSKVRTGVTGSTVRIVCDLKAKATPELSYSTDGKTMILAFAESGTAVNEPSDKPDNPPDNTGNNNSSSDYDPYADGKLVVCIDPGHGVTTGGKRSPDESLREYEFNRDVAYRLKALLEAQGVTCIMTVAKEDQTDPSLATRVQIANSAGNVDLFVSIHANAFGTDWNSANGWEVYTYKTGGDAEKAAKAVEAATKASSAGLKNRGCKTANFYVLKNTTMPAILIEHGFYTNKEECEKLKSSSFRDTLAQADATGIMNFFAQYK